MLDQLAPPTIDHSMPITEASGGQHLEPDPYAELFVLAAALDDLERTRTANTNRLGALVRDCGLTTDSDAYVRLAGLVEALDGVEQDATRMLERAMKRHPLGAFVKATRGVGLKQAARLLAAVGDPYVVAAGYGEDGELVRAERPRRGPAELWAYCGLAPEQRRRKGVRDNWNAEAKMRAHLCAEAIVKATVRKLDGCDDAEGYDVTHREALTPLGDTYLDARAAWADRETSDGHRHAHALRVTAKALLRDLYIEARRIHLGGDHRSRVTQWHRVAANPSTVPGAVGKRLELVARRTGRETENRVAALVVASAPGHARR